MIDGDALGCLATVSSRLPLSNGLLGLNQSHKIGNIAEIYFRREP